MIRRLLKAAVYTVLALLIVLVLISVVGYSLLIRTTSVGDYANFTDLPLNTWASVSLSDETMCSDGSNYRIYTQRGLSNHLLIHFVGGGMAWDAESASQPITLTNFSGYYFPFIWEILRGTASGIFERSHEDNPFRDWNVVYIPYCTADFHSGATDITYSLDNGQSLTIHHNGRRNVTEALDWVFATFDQPEKLVISGESAGAAASVLWTPFIAERYPASDIYQLADGIYLPSTLWSEIFDEVWQADSLSSFGFDVGDDFVTNAYLHYSQNPAPNITYLRIDTLYDGTLLHFSARLNDVPNDGSYRETWSQSLRASTEMILASGLNYQYFITDYGFYEGTGTTPHAILPTRSFFEVEEDGVFLYDWLTRNLDSERFSVGAGFLAE